MKRIQYTKRKQVYNLGPRERVPCWGMQWVWAWQWDGNYGPQCWVPNFPKGLNSLAFVKLAVHSLSAWSIYIYLIYQKKKLKARVSGNNYINYSIKGRKTWTVIWLFQVNWPGSTQERVSQLQTSPHYSISSYWSWKPVRSWHTIPINNLF